jgi:hypothetical protein
VSVGGCIVDIVPVAPDKWWVNTFDKHTECAVYIDPLGLPVAVGDSLWWQGLSCYWTPADRSATDIELPKRGFSGVAHPHAPRCPACSYTLAWCRKYGCSPESL